MSAADTAAKVRATTARGMELMKADITRSEAEEPKPMREQPIMARLLIGGLLILGDLLMSL